MKTNCVLLKQQRNKIIKCNWSQSEQISSESTIINRGNKRQNMLNEYCLELSRPSSQYDHDTAIITATLIKQINEWYQRIREEESISSANLYTEYIAWFIHT